MKQYPVGDPVQAQMAALKNRIDALEGTVVDLVQSFTEVGSLLNALTDEVLADYDDKQQQAFARRVGHAKAAMLNLMREALHEVERGAADPATTTESVAQGQQSAG